MDIKQAKEIDLVGYIESLGFTSTKKHDGWWFCSPFREEKTPSFRVSFQNKFHDFGNGKRGDILDFICILFDVDITGALNILQGNAKIKPFSFEGNQETKKQKSQLVIDEVTVLKSDILFKYIASRKINKQVAIKYLNEIRYHVNDKKYLAIGFQSNKGGYELRSTSVFDGTRFWKGGCGSKYYSLFLKRGSTRINVFEGFPDLLSALSYYKVLTPQHTTVVLNSLVFVEAILPLLSEYQMVYLYLDNDPAGMEAAKKIIEVHPKVANQAEILYKKYKDFNDFLINKPLQS